ncbi:unnamed protein product [Dibothriocephalus latus]|uniref:C2 domain-containing protein n=1 Tax=Dibothriocephalus latus TaxID=60516 RepID=A0A3P6SWG2_DIBLA|nr:unnamed protein product [Dibothriocephalus latus]
MTLLNQSSPDLFADFLPNISTGSSPTPIDQVNSFTSELPYTGKIDGRPLAILFFIFLIIFVILLVIIPIGVLSWVYVRRRKHGTGDSSQVTDYNKNLAISRVSRCLVCESQIQYALEYRLEEESLLLGVIGCRNLAAPPGNGVPSTFVRIWLETVPAQNPMKPRLADIANFVSTAVVSETRNPWFREIFTFSLLPTAISKTVIHMCVYHLHATKAALILGDLEVDLKKTPVGNYFGKYCEVQEPLQKMIYVFKEFGQLCVDINYEKKANVLTVLILDAKDLSEFVKNSHFYPNVQVSVTLLFEGRKSMKEGTAVRRNVANPYFGSLLTFPLMCTNMDLFALEIKLKYYGEMGLTKTHGFVIIGPHSPHTSGRSHWREVAAQPGESFGMWHALTCYKLT